MSLLKVRHTGQRLYLYGSQVMLRTERQIDRKKTTPNMQKKGLGKEQKIRKKKRIEEYKGLGEASLPLATMC